MAVAHYVCIPRLCGGGRYAVIHGYVFDDRADNKADIVIGQGRHDGDTVVVEDIEDQWTLAVNALSVDRLLANNVPVDIASEIVHEIRRWFDTPPRNNR